MATMYCEQYAFVLRFWISYTVIYMWLVNFVILNQVITQLYIYIIWRHKKLILIIISHPRLPLLTRPEEPRSWRKRKLCESSWLPRTSASTGMRDWSNLGSNRVVERRRWKRGQIPPVSHLRDACTLAEVCAPFCGLVLSLRTKRGTKLRNREI